MTAVDKSLARAEYTGLATGTASDGHDYIYAANEGTNPGIQVFNSSFEPSDKNDPRQLHRSQSSRGVYPLWRP